MEDNASATANRHLSDHRSPAATATTTETGATAKNRCHNSCTSTVTSPDQENKESI